MNDDHPRAMSITDELLDCESCARLAPSPYIRKEPGAGMTTRRVRAGESLMELAREYGLTLCDLLQHNPHINPYHYVEGEAVNVPVQGGGCPAGLLHTVRAGEELGGIAEAYHIAASDVATANPGTDLEQLEPGQILCLPKTAVPPEASLAPAEAPELRAIAFTAASAPPAWRFTPYRKG